MFCLERRNLALTQPGVSNSEEVDSLLINEDNPPDGNFLFGEEVSRSVFIARIVRDFIPTLTTDSSGPFFNLHLLGYEHTHSDPDSSGHILEAEER